MSDYIPIRLSHLLRHCSVGAIVRGPDYLMVVKDIREWTDRNGQTASRLIPYVDQVRAACGIEKELREPPTAKELDKGQIDGVCVPAMRFPSWMRCPTCGYLDYQPWRGLQSGDKPHCKRQECNKHPILEQVTWVLVHSNGYLADVPWDWLAHRDAKTPDQKQCHAGWEKPCLHLNERKISCQICNSTGKIPDDRKMRYGNRRQQPWLKFVPDGLIQTDLKNIDEESALVVEINDARVHYPTTCNALVIPPESRIRKGTIVDRLYRSSQNRQKIDQSRNELSRRGLFKSLASEFRCSPEEVDAAWKDIQNGYPLYGANPTPGMLLESEYKALIDELPGVFDDEDFVARHHTDAWRSIENDLPKNSNILSVVRSVNRLVAVTKLKEIQVFRGFKRVKVDGRLVPPDIDDHSDWVPAIELYGEGVFFTLSEDVLQRWEKNTELIRRAETSKLRYEKANFSENSDPEQTYICITPRFLLMHTLAHILVRQLESAAGYPAASLKERIYYTRGKQPMSGILIYVAVHDVVGSLGGLAELAEPRRFLRLLSGAFTHAEWCSFDPVCAEHEGQGPQLLNRAACHACSLIPEPSCAYGNVLLDRVFIKGDLASCIPSFLNYVDSVG
jgi:hypothetical protein